MCLRDRPFPVKTDLRDNYPFGLFAVPQGELVRIHASSGTTGKQTVVGYTAHDIDIWAEGAARALTAAGGTRNDIVHVSYGYGLFTGGLGLHYGAEHMGATALPVSSGNTKRQVQLLQDFGSDSLCCTPSYACLVYTSVPAVSVSGRGDRPDPGGIRSFSYTHLVIEAQAGGDPIREARLHRQAVPAYAQQPLPPPDEVQTGKGGADLLDVYKRQAP